MKTCLLCNADAPDDAATCPNDGEASWSESAATAPALAESDDVEVKPKARRVSR